MKLPGAAQVELHRRVGSTNQRLLDWARDGALPFSVVVAREQTAGRGRGGKRWVSGVDAGLWMSVLLPSPPGGPPGAAPVAVGVAAAEAVEAVAGVEVGLKWPNDLLVRTSPDRPLPGKVGGVLCEVVLPGREAGGVAGIVAGIGVNLRRPKGAGGKGASGALAGAAFLEDAADRRIEEGELAVALLATLRELADPPPDRADARLLEAWDRRDLLRGRRVRATAGAEGTAAGIGVDGRLLVSDGAGVVRSVRGGTVRLVGEGPPALFAEPDRFLRSPAAPGGP